MLLFQAKLLDLIQQMEIGRVSAQSEWPSTLPPLTPQLFRSIFPYSGDILYAQLFSGWCLHEFYFIFMDSFLCFYNYFRAGILCYFSFLRLYFFLI